MEEGSPLNGEPSFLLLHSDARGHSKGGRHGGKDGDENVQNFLDKFFLVHGSGIV